MHFLPSSLPPSLSSHIIAVAVIRLVAKVITRDDDDDDDGDGKSWRRCGKWSVSDKEGVRGEVGGDARKEGSLGMC